MNKTIVKQTAEDLSVTEKTTSGRIQSCRPWLRVVSVLVTVSGILTLGIHSRIKAAADVRALTEQLAVPSVSTARPQQAASAQELVLPGNVQPFISSPI